MCDKDGLGENANKKNTKAPKRDKIDILESVVTPFSFIKMDMFSMNILFIWSLSLSVEEEQLSLFGGENCILILQYDQNLEL